MRPVIRLLAYASAALLGGATGCLPYTVGSTAQTVPEGRTVYATSYYFIPNAFKRPGDTLAAPLMGVDQELRYGEDSRSDIGFRLTSGLGGVINYKRRFRDYDEHGPAMAYMVGAGIVNMGLHAHFEGTLIASGDERAALMPYGGLRIMQVLPISSGAVYDSPTVGGFGGVQLANGDFALRPELGVFYDRSALHVRSANFIIVPAFTIQRRRRSSEMRTLPRPDLQGSRTDRGERGPTRVPRLPSLPRPGPG